MAYPPFDHFAGGSDEAVWCRNSFCCSVWRNDVAQKPHASKNRDRSYLLGNRPPQSCSVRVFQIIVTLLAAAVLVTAVLLSAHIL